MPDGPDGPALEAAIDHALADVFAGTGSMVNRWLGLVEIVDESGERGVWTFTSAGLMRWDSWGLLQHALIEEQAAAIAEHRDD